MSIEALTAETVEKYRKEIAQFYYDNVSSCSCMGHYSFKEAYEISSGKKREYMLTRSGSEKTGAGKDMGKNS